ncbi:hypothetical protein, partial [Candidatus Avelusimicrobium alvi]|uniref:hypothetical protein n=1 Tax=Candidatus Avelusimicrobium alvi TaxID=3416221 RepID=UPI003D0EFD50
SFPISTTSKSYQKKKTIQPLPGGGALCGHIRLIEPHRFYNYSLLFVPTKSRQKTRRSGPIKRTRGGCFYNSLSLKQVKTFFRLEAFYKQG